MITLLTVPPLVHIPSRSLWAGSAQLSEGCKVWHIILRRVKIMCTKYELVLFLIGFESHIVFSPGALFISYSVKCYGKKKTSENNVRNILVILGLLMGVHRGLVDESWGHSRNFTEYTCCPRYSAVLWWWIGLSPVNMGSLSINCSNVRVFLEHWSAEL